MSRSPPSSVKTPATLNCRPLRSMYCPHRILPFFKQNILHLGADNSCFAFARSKVFLVNKPAGHDVHTFYVFVVGMAGFDVERGIFFTVSGGHVYRRRVAGSYHGGSLYVFFQGFVSRCFPERCGGLMACLYREWLFGRHEARCCWRHLPKNCLRFRFEVRCPRPTKSPE